jgi:hypothetical protein
MCEQLSLRVYVQGRDAESMQPCSFTGTEVLKAYKEIYERGHCPRCGTKHYSDECIVSIDWTGNRRKGLGGALNAGVTQLAGKIGKEIGGALGNFGEGVVAAAGSFAGGLIGAG